MKRRSHVWIVPVLAIALVSTGSAAQTPAAKSSATRGSPVVNIPFFAEDGHGQRSGITAIDLSVWDNQTPPLSIVAVKSARDLPLRLGVLIDSSSSERASGVYRPALAALTDFLHQGLTGPDDKVFVGNFSSSVQATGFMDKDEFLKSNTNVTPGGGTAFFDAINFACKERMGADSTPARRVLIVLSDGGDNISHVTHDEAIIAAQKAGTVIFAVSTSEQGDNVDNARLEQFGEETGGRAYLHLGAKDVPLVFRSIRQQIDNMYVLSYIPPEHSTGGQRRTFELKAASDKKLKLRAPTAYYSSPSAP